MSNRTLSGHPRLHRRGAAYYLRAAVPQDVQAIVGRREVWRSLKTKDRAEALRRVREASVEFDREMAAHRAHITTKPVDVLSEAQLQTLTDLLLHHHLADDEEHRATEVTPETAADDMRWSSWKRCAPGWPHPTSMAWSPYTETRLEHLESATD